METVLKGTLVSKQDLNVFDEVLTFLTKDGRLLKCVGLGTRKITSKNGRSLVVGNQGEIEAFLARTDGKLSKLKKFTATSTMENEIASSYAVSFAMEAICANLLESSANRFLEDAVRLVRLIGDDRSLVYLVLSAMKAAGMPFVTDRCVTCGMTEWLRLSYKAGGAKCPSHYDPKSDGAVDERSADLLRSINAFGYRPLVTWRGEISPLLAGVMAYFQWNAGYSSKTLASLQRWQRRVIKDQ